MSSYDMHNMDDDCSPRPATAGANRLAANIRAPESAGNVIENNTCTATGILMPVADASNVRDLAFLGTGKGGFETHVSFRCPRNGDAATDSERGIRGFDVRIRTPNGDWDIIGTNMPVSLPEEAADESASAHEGMLGYCSMHPETTHLVTAIMSDRGIPATYCHMHGYASSTFLLDCSDGVQRLAKFCFRTLQGIVNLTDEEAAVVGVLDPQFHANDLREAIDADERPSWMMCMQTMTLEEAETCGFDPLDTSKVWPHAMFPSRNIGIIQLTANHEPVRMDRGNLVPGISIPAGWLFACARDDYSQPGRLIAAMDDMGHRELVGNTARMISRMDVGTALRHLVHCCRIDPVYGRRVAAALGMTDEDVELIEGLGEEELMAITT
ncbi:MAG: catalase [Candidatus Methanomethylophilaceae archaeon]|nr:catalase [Candidatus Methanomethylophilaceae archaeon]